MVKEIRGLLFLLKHVLLYIVPIKHHLRVIPVIDGEKQPVLPGSIRKFGEQDIVLAKKKPERILYGNRSAVGEIQNDMLSRKRRRMMI